MTGGIGWLDRQWVHGMPRAASFVNLIKNISLVRSYPKALGRYIWTNLHLKDTDDHSDTSHSTQYMVYGFIDEKSDVKKGLEVPSKAICYSASRLEPVWNKQATIKILNTVTDKTNNNTIYPSEMEISVDGKTYRLDNTPYGNNITIDLSGNPHWAGAADLTVGDKVVGTAFNEFNQFQDKETYTSTILKNAGVKNPKKVYKLWTKSGYLTFAQALPSILLLLALLVALVVMIVFIVIAVRGKRGKTGKTGKRKNK
jgi:hypothetical protein